MESQQPSSSSAPAESPPDILLLKELSQCNQIFRQLMDRKEEGDKLNCLTRFLEMWQKISQSDELKIFQQQNQQKDADKQIEEGQQQKLQIRKQMGQKGIEMIRMIEDQIDELTLFTELMWQKMAEMMKPTGRRLSNELCAEMVKAMPLSAKLTQNEKLQGTVIGHYIQEGLNKLTSLTPNNYWDEYDCHQMTLSDDQLTVTWGGEDFDIFGEESGFDVGDWVGCGVHLATGQMFFTRNGTFLGVATVLPTFTGPTDVFPMLSFIDEDTIVETNIGRQPFQWKCTDADLAIMMRGDGPTHLGEADKARLAEETANWHL